jgi:hypothetical protein
MNEIKTSISFTCKIYRKYFGRGEFKSLKVNGGNPVDREATRIWLCMGRGLVPHDSCTYKIVD